MKIKVSSRLNKKMLHRNYENASSELFTTVSKANPGEVVCLTGPSRVGKTSLIEELIKSLTDGVKSKNEDQMTCVSVEAANSGRNGTFSTKSFVFRILQALKHPVYRRERSMQLDESMIYKQYNQMREPRMSSMLEDIFIEKNTQYLIIDEAQHVRYAGRNVLAGSAVMDEFKGWASQAGFVLVLVGAYPILEIIGESPHLVGRKHQVHFPRYYYEDADLDEFASIIHCFGQELHLHKTIDTLTDEIEMLYKGSFGCFGLLERWLSSAESEGIRKGTGITKEILLRSAMSDFDREKIYREISDGENKLRTTDLDVIESLKEPPKNNPAKKKQKRKPFQKKPQRHKPGNRE